MKFEELRVGDKVRATNGKHIWIVSNECLRSEHFKTEWADGEWIFVERPKTESKVKFEDLKPGDKVQWDYGNGHKPHTPYTLTEESLKNEAFKLNYNSGKWVAAERPAPKNPTGVPFELKVGDKVQWVYRSGHEGYPRAIIQEMLDDEFFRSNYSRGKWKLVERSDAKDVWQQHRSNEEIAAMYTAAQQETPVGFKVASILHDSIVYEKTLCDFPRHQGPEIIHSEPVNYSGPQDVYEHGSNAAQVCFFLRASAEADKRAQAYIRRVTHTWPHGKVLGSRNTGSPDRPGGYINYFWQDEDA